MIPYEFKAIIKERNQAKQHGELKAMSVCENEKKKRGKRRRFLSFVGSIKEWQFFSKPQRRLDCSGEQ